jgi:hypothetical protein
MGESKPHCRGRKPKAKIASGDVQGSRLLAQIMTMLAPLHDHCPEPKRKLHYDEFCAWLLIYFFTPVLDSMRGLQQASDIESLRQRLKLPRFSLGSFSEAATVFDPQLLAAIIEMMGQSLVDIEPRQGLLDLGKRPTVVDATLIHALPKMLWALWRDEENRAVKLHLHLDLLRGVPEHATLTHGQASEIDELRKSLRPGRLYITDRGYFSFDLMAEILSAGSSFVARVRNNIVYETLEERILSDGNRRDGIVADRIVRAGWKPDANAVGQKLRLVEIHVPDSGAPARRARVDSKSKSYRTRETDHTLFLLTDQLTMDVDMIALLYRYRWQVELFFRWFKKVLEADHLLSLSQNGLTIVMYCALIASMLITLWTGRKPTKRTFEMLCFYFGGWASDAELLAHIARLKELEKTK